MRDLLKDKAICEAAYKGPWEPVEKGWFGVDNCAKIVSVDQSSSFSCMVYIASMYAGAHQKANATFIAAARTGWPEAIDRAIAAENVLKEVSELLSWRDSGNGQQEALKLIYDWALSNQGEETKG